MPPRRPAPSSGLQVARQALADRLREIHRQTELPSKSDDLGGVAVGGRQPDAEGRGQDGEGLVWRRCTRTSRAGRPGGMPATASRSGDGDHRSATNVRDRGRQIEGGAMEQRPKLLAGRFVLVDSASTGSFAVSRRNPLPATTL